MAKISDNYKMEQKLIAYFQGDITLEIIVLWTKNPLDWKEKRSNFWVGAYTICFAVRDEHQNQMIRPLMKTTDFCHRAWRTLGGTG